MKRVSVADLKSGESGIVVAIRGGRWMRTRLDAMGIRVGVAVKKITGQFLRGPVTVQVGATQLAIGHGRARRIIVEVDE